MDSLTKAQNEEIFLSETDSIKQLLTGSKLDSIKTTIKS